MPEKSPRHKVEAGSEGRADRVVQRLTGLSRARVFGLFDHGCVFVNGAPCREAGRRTKPGDVIDVRYDPERKYRLSPPVKEDPALRIVHEDEHLVVIDKSAGVLTVPTHAREEDTLVHRLARKLGGRRVEVVHRLDRGTSGLLVFAKSRDVAVSLKHQFQQRKPERVYYAIVAGRMEGEKGTIRSHLATDQRLNRFSTEQPEKGQLAVTHWEVVRRVRGATLMRVRLETGRRNQIRVHCVEAGHPIVGDARYGQGREGHPEWTWRRLALHAATLGFTHPVTGAPLRFDSEMPRAMAIFLDRAEKAGRARSAEERTAAEGSEKPRTPVEGRPPRRRERGPVKRPGGSGRRGRPPGASAR